ncbi:uncharacterized protein TRUGW13939_10825 [Talaromyces rugulosus]|uniref:Uncharacterized protein n=1 Tax=Talaromyces rugulosus TaxID=121627 RepID=A0A7H8RB40_TALRU|nr:uncharacterized protein TRUGW13939_10825 [Talaromyces rugulosus]QKX63654.1 hypothetical protein TRUGW13939_10825 [Talaromyces rugulosus]
MRNHALPEHAAWPAAPPASHDALRAVIGGRDIVQREEFLVLMHAREKIKKTDILSRLRAFLRRASSTTATISISPRPPPSFPLSASVSPPASCVAPSFFPRSRARPLPTTALITITPPPPPLPPYPLLSLSLLILRVGKQLLLLVPPTRYCTQRKLV